MVKLTTASASMAFGGSSVSWSVTWAASTVTVHDSSDSKSSVGSRENAVGPPVTTAACEPDFVQLMVNHGSTTSTGSENVTETLASKATSAVSFAGVVAATVGATSTTRGVRLNSSTARPSSELEDVEVDPAHPEGRPWRDRGGR